jgi:hypothetical protein
MFALTAVSVKPGAFTVSVKLVVAVMLPEVPVTVNVYIPGAVELLVVSWR